MDEDLPSQEQAVLDALRRQRGTCPSVEELVAFTEGELSEGEATALEEHLILCPRCQELVEVAAAEPAEVDDLSWRRVEGRLDARPWPWRSRRWRPMMIGGVAAALAIAVGVGIFLTAREPALIPGEPVTRGVGIQLVAPLGTVAPPTWLEWTAPPADLTYRVELTGGGLRWETTASGSSVELPPEVVESLEPGVTYRWQVQGSSTEGQEVLESTTGEFLVEPNGLP